MDELVALSLCPKCLRSRLHLLECMCLAPSLEALFLAQPRVSQRKYSLSEQAYIRCRENLPLFYVASTCFSAQQGFSATIGLNCEISGASCRRVSMFQFGDVVAIGVASVVGVNSHPVRREKDTGSENSGVIVSKRMFFFSPRHRMLRTDITSITAQICKDTAASNATSTLQNKAPASQTRTFQQYCTSLDVLREEYVHSSRLKKHGTLTTTAISHGADTKRHAHTTQHLSHNRTARAQAGSQDKQLDMWSEDGTMRNASKKHKDLPTASC